MTGLKASWKAQLESPANVKKLIIHFHRRLTINDPSVPPDKYGLQDIKPFIWNGQVMLKSCLIDRPFAGDSVCGDIPDDLNNWNPQGVSVQGNGPGAGGNLGPSITYQPGTPSPTCQKSCGTLCTGFYCAANPTGTPPDFTDPINNPTFTGKLTGLPTLTGTNAGPKPTGSCLASGAVVSCNGNGRACITTTICTEYATATPSSPATKTTPPSPPPSPVPKNYFIIIALEELLNYNDFGGTWTRSWCVFWAPLSGTIDLCEARAILDQETLGGTALNPGLPPALGPLNTNDFRCEYRGKDSELGTLVCEGVRDMWCEKVEKPDKQGCTALNNPVMVPVVICRW